MTVRKRTSAPRAVALAAAVVALAGCGANTTADHRSSPGASPTSSATADTDCRHYLAFLGPVTGAARGAAFSADVLGGIRLALAQAPDSGLCLKDPFDTEVASQDQPGRSADRATAITKDHSIIGVVGPGLSIEAMTTGSIFADAGLAEISPSVGSEAMSQRGWHTWHRLVGTDAAQGAAAARYLTRTLGADRAMVIDDGSLYGTGLARVVRNHLGATLVGRRTVTPGQTRFTRIVSAVRQAKADAVYYAGYFPEAGLLVKQLRAAGWTGHFMSGGGANDPAFVSVAGPAANGSILTTAAGPPQQDFASAFFALNDHPAGVYSTHAYDATRIFLAAVAAGHTTRPAVNRFVSAYRGEGLGGPIAFDAHGDLKKSVVYAWTVTSGALDLTVPAAIR